MGLRGPERGGPRAPRPPKMVILGSFWPFWGQKTLNLSFSAWNGPQRPPQKWFFTTFSKKRRVPPREIAKIEKKVSFSAWNFPKLSKSYEKTPPFSGILGVLGPMAPQRPPKGPQRASNDRFRLSIPSTTSFLWPLLCFSVDLFRYSERVTTHKTLQRPTVLKAKSHSKKPILACQYPKPPALFGPCYGCCWFIYEQWKGLQRIRPSKGLLQRHKKAQK